MNDFEESHCQAKLNITSFFEWRGERTAFSKLDENVVPLGHGHGFCCRRAINATKCWAGKEGKKGEAEGRETRRCSWHRSTRVVLKESRKREATGRMPGDHIKCCQVGVGENQHHYPEPRLFISHS